MRLSAVFPYFVLKDCICVNNASMLSSYFVARFDQGGQPLHVRSDVRSMEGLLAADCVIGQLVAPYFRMQNHRRAPDHEIIHNGLSEAPSSTTLC